MAGADADLQLVLFSARLHIRIVLLAFAVFVISGYAPACAEPRIELERMRIEPDVNTVRIVFGFDRLPLYDLSTSGQKVEITFTDTYVNAGITVPDDNESIARILIGESSERLLLSFLLRRPPAFVNAVRRPAKKEITLDIYWRDQEQGSRPAISRSLPGGIHIAPVGGASRRVIASKYSGHWEKFLLDYDRHVKLDIPIEYTLPPFPALGLFLPVSDVVPLEVMEAGARGDWEGARNAYTGAGFGALSQRENRIRSLVLADIALREDECFAAENLLRGLFSVREDAAVSSNEGDNNELVRCADMLELYVAGCLSDKPFDLLAELNLVVAEPSELRNQPYVTLLQAEAELAAGRIQIVLQLLDGLKNRELKPEGVLQRREADAHATREDFGSALEIYPDLDAAGYLEDAPRSLSLYAEALYANKRYAEAQEVFSRLHDMVEEQPLRDLVKYFIARSMLQAGKGDGALAILAKIMPGTRASSLAQLKLADLGAVNPDAQSRRQALADYTELEDEMPTREGKAEVQFKRALTYHLLQRPEQAIALLRDFLHIDRVSELRPYAQALLAEILPPYIDSLIEKEQYFDAMLLVEQNRDILVATQRNYAFLLNLGQVFSELEFHSRAVKLYQYVLDSTEDKGKREAVYVPLIESLYAIKDYPKVAMYAQRYLSRFDQDGGWKNDEHAASVYLNYLKALMALGREGEVEELLRVKDRPRSDALDRFGARFFWTLNQISAAGEQLRALIVNGNPDPWDLYIYAESLYAKEDFATALKYYKRLIDVAEYRLQAQYRMGNILLDEGERERGLTFLTRVAESNGESRWKRLAQQSLLMQRLK